ncbi:MAG TPA: DUF2279 domain-containing protein [Kofleriaceae bacterium]|nr:DUF2279 domain-containing protein [Kofleriaceae bacterium]
MKLVLVLVFVLAAPIAHADPLPPAVSDAEPEPLYSKDTAIVLVAGTWAAASTYAYFAWFRHATRTTDPLYTLEGFGVNTYAGGADKLGHFWAGHMFSYLTTEALVHGGYRTLPSSLVGFGLSQLFGTISEYKDSLHYQFEFGDIIANCSGALFNVLLENWPALDRLIDLRLDYWPTTEYLRLLRHGNIDGAQDYSGQSYLFAVHLRAVPGLDSPWLGWSKYVDAVIGFETRNYAPMPDDPSAIRRQVLYGGFAIDMQAVLEAVFPDSTGRRVGHGVLEFVSVPFTTVRLEELTRSP